MLGREPLSRLVLETMGLGTPVIAWASGGNPEIIDSGETGWLVGNADDLSGALAELESPGPPREGRRRRSRLPRPELFAGRRVSESRLRLRRGHREGRAPNQLNPPPP